MRRPNRQTVHKFFLVVFFIQIPPAILLGWVHSTAYVSVLSIHAIVVGHWGALEATKPPEES